MQSNAQLSAHAEKLFHREKHTRRACVQIPHTMRTHKHNQRSPTRRKPAPHLVAKLKVKVTRVGVKAKVNALTVVPDNILGPRILVGPTTYQLLKPGHRCVFTQHRLNT